VNLIGRSDPSAARRFPLRSTGGHKFPESQSFPLATDATMSSPVDLAHSSDAEHVHDLVPTQKHPHHPRRQPSIGLIARWARYIVRCSRRGGHRWRRRLVFGYIQHSRGGAGGSRCGRRRWAKRMRASDRRDLIGSGAIPSHSPYPFGGPLVSVKGGSTRTPVTPVSVPPRRP